MHIYQTLTTLALLAPLALVQAQTDSNGASQTVGITSALEPTCPTITVTTGSTCPQITPVCIRPLCIQISTITQPCSCDSVPPVTSCATACGTGCATSTSVAHLPCPVTPSGTGAGTGSMPTQTASYGNGTTTVTPTATTSMVIATGAAAAKEVRVRGGLILGFVGVVMGLL